MPEFESQPKINLLNDFKQREIRDQDELLPPKKSKKIKILFFVAVFIFFFLISFFSPLIVSTKNILRNFGSGNVLGFWQTVVKLINAQDKLLKGEENDRINILLLGMGGKGHEGPYLTDTVILVSIKPSEKKTALFSIPRDLYVPVPGFGWRKINIAYTLGEISKKEGGELTSQAVENIFELPIHYFVACDFNGFKKIIDDAGGIDVYVEKSFTDNQYPFDDLKTQTISFKEGKQKMSGEEALKFVRSRHGTNNENSDFARSKRQQKVILALKNKILSFGTLINPTKISNLLNGLNENVKTNLELYEIIKLTNLAKNIDNSNVIAKVLDNGADGLLSSTIAENGAYILKPKAGNFKEIAFVVNNIFKVSGVVNAAISTDKDSNVPSNYGAKIIVKNGTVYPGLAAKTAENLKSEKFELIKIGNSLRRDYEKTIVCDLTEGGKKEALEILKEKLEADACFSNPDLETDESGADFLIILGKNAIPLANTN